MVVVAGQRIAVFQYDGRVFATSNVCRHQGGPLGEGRVIDGCVTCPWHGWNYEIEDGVSPPPFNEVIPTYRVEVAEGRVRVNPWANPLKTINAGASLPGNEERLG